MPPFSSPSSSADAAEPVKLVLSGYYGYNNLGDEAILAALVQQVRALAPQAEIVALSGDPVRTRERLAIGAVHRLDLTAVVRCMREADVFISGGGSLLQDVTGPGSIPYYLGLLKMAQWLGLPTMMLGQGVGPLNHAASRWLVGRVASQADAVTVRDTASRQLLVRCGVPLERVRVTADPVLALEPIDEAAAAALWTRLGLDPALPTVAVAIRPWSTWFERQLKAFSAVLAQQASSWGAQILLLPFHRPDDEGLVEELENCLAARPEGHRPPIVTVQDMLTPAEMLGLLGRVDLLIGMRLHALIMAAARSVPSIGLVYDPKVTAFCDLAGFPTLASVTALEDCDTVARVMSEVWEERSALKAGLDASREGWRALALENVECALGLARRTHVRIA